MVTVEGENGGGVENIAWHGWGRGTKKNYAPHSHLSQSTQFHMTHVMILIITFTESFFSSRGTESFLIAFQLSCAWAYNYIVLHCMSNNWSFKRFYFFVKWHRWAEKNAGFSLAGGEKWREAGSGRTFFPQPGPNLSCFCLVWDFGNVSKLAGMISVTLADIITVTLATKHPGKAAESHPG